MQPAWASLRLLGRLVRGEEDSEDAVEALIQTASSMPPQWPFWVYWVYLLCLFLCFFWVAVFFLGDFCGVGWFVHTHPIHTYPHVSISIQIYAHLSTLNPSKSPTNLIPGEQQSGQGL